MNWASNQFRCVMAKTYATAELIQRNQYIYIATSEAYAQKNQFKVGISIKPNGRLSTYNTGRMDDDKYYYCYMRRCHNARAVEVMVFSLLDNWRPNKKKEMVVMQYTDLVHIIDHTMDQIDACVDNTNQIIAHATKSITGFAIPRPISEYDGRIFNISDRVNRHGEYHSELGTFIVLKKCNKQAVKTQQQPWMKKISTLFRMLKIV